MTRRGGRIMAVARLIFPSTVSGKNGGAGVVDVSKPHLESLFGDRICQIGSGFRLDADVREDGALKALPLSAEVLHGNG